MFIQVIQGRVADADGLRTAVERWQATIAPRVPGWLGTTGGVTDDGTAVAVVRFDSAQTARANSERPEQQEWWAEASKYFSGDVVFHDCAEVLTFGAGGSDDAGFVQIVQAPGADTDRLRALLDQFGDALHEFRPEIIGGTIAVHGDGGFTESVYFTSEQAARAGEQKPAPPELKEFDDEVVATLRDASFYDLRRPWFFSAG